MRKNPVFVSCPTKLSQEQDKKRALIIEYLNDLQLEPRALGRGDYPKDYPLKEVFIIVKHCAGGVILGFEQILVQTGSIRRETPDAKLITPEKSLKIPTPWNHLEAGILFGLKLPLLIFKEEGIEGGVFDYGISDAFIHNLPEADPDVSKKDELKQVFLKWFAKVSERYNEY